MAATMKLRLSPNFVLSITRSLRQRWPAAKSFSLSASISAKRVEVTTEDNKTVIEGKPLESEVKSPVRKIQAATGCPLCEFQDKLTYRDVLILHQFISPDGRILPKHVTGMCHTMQWKLERLLYQSYSAGLLPNYKPDLPIGEDPKTYEKSYKWRKNNVYYEDFSFENPL
ncbi:39S ribosomal protein S18a, mitochondrial [Aplysia californica]|uniref:39S ribosomal protein S18a, mitochondrial n=1 Tax=Aplysia californica TaxID=6500 RepID=A0ABM0JPQ0_APLCA|nr:39S ribosomal protein S18a, mitochondrial [Aplysia californica]